LETLDLRLAKSCANALQIARSLEKYPGIKEVRYPGLASSPCHKIARSQFPNGYGSLVGLCLESREACFALMDKCRIVRRATNIHDNKTLIIHPASTIFCEYSAEEKAKMEVSENLLRLSVGIEDATDIMEDLTAAI
jgi:O-acetylhomoserine (thiol)-lyase